MRMRQFGLRSAAMCLFAAVTLHAAERDELEPDSRTVIGERNPALSDGARRLLAGDIEEGIRLTRLGLDAATTSRERQAGLSNLCAGYVRLARADTALDYCNAALGLNPKHWRALCNRALVYMQLGNHAAADADLSLAESIAPDARSVKLARGLWRDATDPVAPRVVIDDRREADESSDEN